MALIIRNWYIRHESNCSYFWFAGFDVLTVVGMNLTDSWELMSCNLASVCPNATLHSTLINTVKFLVYSTGGIREKKTGDVRINRSQWLRGLRCRTATARLLRSWVRIPPRTSMFLCYECCVLSGRGLCDELVTRLEKSYRMWCVVVCDQETSRMRRSWPALGHSDTGGGGG